MFLITCNYQFLPTAIQQPFHSLCTERIKKIRDFPLVLHEEIPHEPRHYVGEILIAEDFYLYFFDISNGKVVGLIPQEHVN